MSATDATVSFSEGVDSTSPNLLWRLRAGDPAAWGRCTRLYTPMVVRWCRLAGVREADVADVVQEVFSAAHRGLPAFRHTPGRGAFRAWLRTIARHEAFDYREKLGPAGAPAGGSQNQREIEELADSDPSLPEPGEEEDAEENLRLMALALDATLVDTQQLTRDVFWKLVIENRTADELAAEYGITRGAVYSMKSRVMKKLRLEYDGLIDL